MVKVNIDKETLEDVVKQVLTEYNRQQYERLKVKKDRRLRNTRLLLRNYNNFFEHCKNAIYMKEELEEEDPIEILMESEFEDDLFINSIKRTSIRTKIILDHIESIMDYYRFKANNSKDEKFIRRLKIIELIYFNEGNYSYEQLAEMFYVDSRTVSRDVKKAIEELSVLLFGIDGLKIEL
ncbi:MULTISPECIES: HTH domain-containing protein [Clostridium]|uniref:HTH domain-containing protein n=1 Tax=Clostridium faecium TaxID=2762223 RepID=A0ABR8YR88_9CLOT|nr:MULTISPECIES: HTH domain-containing protein [Clostridium]MBD8046769.1 HTH domain-containing protein [Clostridium faecium]